MQERLQKILANAGIGSRRVCEKWIVEGRVRVDGKIITELGIQYEASLHKITFDGRIVRSPDKRYYILLNKPRGVVCSLSDTHAARLVTDLVDIQGNPLLRPVGRLDADSDGLIILSDDGEFINRLTHPRYHVGKTYKVCVKGTVEESTIRALKSGVRLEDGVTTPAENVRVLRVYKAGEDDQSDVQLTIHEGRNRQVRRMMKALGHPVLRLTRVAIGSVRLTQLPAGAWRHLTKSEIESLVTSKTEELTNEEKSKICLTEVQLSKQQREPSSRRSSRTPRPSRPRTLSNWSKKDSTTG